jgi:hypothetical protein
MPNCMKKKYTDLHVMSRSKNVFNIYTKLIKIPCVEHRYRFVYKFNNAFTALKQASTVKEAQKYIAKK